MGAKIVPQAGWTLPEWRSAYINGMQAQDAVEHVLAQLPADDNAWISRATPQQITKQLTALNARLDAAGGDLSRLPLFGVPFAAKDNIDAAGWETTAACPAFAYEPAASATVVQRMLDAGAILIGKTNLDQFATGLNGTRSPYGPVPNTFDERYVSGGSSSGSSSVVARGLVPFAFGTDTAGSGRIPAGFNNIVGLKPTKGWLSNAGVVPACRTLDCVSVFALTVDDAQLIAHLAGGFDAADPYSREPQATSPLMRARPRFCMPDQLQWFGDHESARLFSIALAQLKEAGVDVEPVDFAPFLELAELLYQGAFVAERVFAAEHLLATKAYEINPVVRGIMQGAAQYSAVDTFRAEYRRAELSRIINQTLAGFDALVVPTSPSIYSIEDMLDDPITLNSRFGTYTNFANFSDLCALSLPAGFRNDGLPFGITLLAPAWHDDKLAAFGRRWQQSRPLPLGATGRSLPALPAVAPAASADHHVRVAVVGAHLTGMPLNVQLQERNAILVERTHTAPKYRLYALANTTPPKPGLVKVDSGAAIEIELWDVPLSAFGSFVALIPAPLGIGTLETADGRSVKGFICEPWAIADATDITHFGGWRAYIASLQTAKA
ncbi:allophanate hydrolase [Silvimonas iriomotensis]|uniref:Allophanate hydrolase n=1 Tax=Silvimonas iriomotensis TaxID=449662 RepID=A0ABQ2PCA6_9NEIS|nr:allophanate hydrolase [Silvimonas iriomotensis]GGP22971.1 allophanate hydrolase [Silvimonas iriomotensis]